MTDRNRTAIRLLRSLLAAGAGLLLVSILFNGTPFLRATTAGAGGEAAIYLPGIWNSPLDVVQVQTIRTLDAGGTTQLAFEREVPIVHRIAGVVLGGAPVEVTLRLTESGTCGAGSLYDETLVLAPGPWQIDIPAAAPDCPGLYSSTAVAIQDGFVDELAGQYVVNDPFGAVLHTDQGFDRCVPPSVDTMAAWWAESPYSVVNIYLGGVHYPSFCQTGIQDAIWVHKVASQGWSFTTVWVGPQAPCTGFTHRMSSNPAIAYEEGREEADAAAAKARVFGLFGGITIHYDIEGYFGNTACRAAVQSFVQGWTDRLHELGLKAGAYGSGCGSSVSDWANNAPTIDQVWIAHWALPAQYDPDAVVWNAACVSNSLWDDHERLKQYAGDHAETWGGATITIDSNVFDTFAIAGAAGSADPPEAAARIEAFAPLGAASGWLQQAGRLYRTADLGATWQEITPPAFTVLGTAFLDDQNGYAAGWPDGADRLHLARTEDGGGSWSIGPVDAAGDLAPYAIAGVFLDVLDEASLWLAVKLPSGSSFSLGRLYASTDGGTSWEERTHPLGEPVVFEDGLLGWTLGGPAGVSAYRTLDGGRSWTAVELSTVPGEISRPGPDLLPPGAVSVASLGEITWTLAQDGRCTGEKSAQVCLMHVELLVTLDGGASWTAIPSPD